MPSPTRPPGLIQRYREELRARHDACRTVETYEQWLRRFLRFHRPGHPREMGSEEVNAFLTHLAVELQAGDHVFVALRTTLEPLMDHLLDPVPEDSLLPPAAEPAPVVVRRST